MPKYIDSRCEYDPFKNCIPTSELVDRFTGRSYLRLLYSDVTNRYERWLPCETSESYPGMSNGCKLTEGK
jgi:hypothetical protein